MKEEKRERNRRKHLRGAKGKGMEKKGKEREKGVNFSKKKDLLFINLFSFKDFL